MLNKKNISSVSFENKFCEMHSNLYFKVKDDGEIVAVLELSEGHEIVMSIDTFRSSAGIEEKSNDDIVLKKVCEGLQYVTCLMMKDKFPTEITLGVPSWKPLERHLLISRYRLSLQLVGWVTGQEITVTSAKDVMVLINDRNMKENIFQAFCNAAEKLGLERTNHDAVIAKIEALACELSYVEFIKDIFNDINIVNQKVQGIRKAFGSDIVLGDTVSQVGKLLILGVEKINLMIKNIDAQTCEIIPMLENPTRHIEFIKKSCDELYRHLRPWELIINDWKLAEVAMTSQNVNRIHNLYRFLAPRYMKVNDWIQLLKAQKSENNRMPMNVMRW